ncbi:MAG TPA: hypothetical protein VK092_05540, partial [Deinococcales bacterium]|nr:hypothetical protein [Deinococcales bacterium]
APQLRVDGTDVAPVDQETVPGVAYAPAAAYAAALGAKLTVTDRSVELTLGAHTVGLTVSDDPALVFLPDGVRLNGEPREGHLAVRTGSSVLLPVKTVAAAFGGHVTVLSGPESAVAVWLPRPRLTGVEVRRSGGRTELVITISAPAEWSEYFNEARNTLELRFPAAEIRTTAVPDSAAFRQVRLTPGRGDTAELHVAFAGPAAYELESRASGGGWELAVVLDGPGAHPQRGAGQADAMPATGSTVIIDPGTAPGLAEFADAFAAELEERGVRTGRSGSSAAEGDLTVQLRLTDSTSTVTYLAEAESRELLAAAVREAGGDEEAVARLRRTLLLAGSGEADAARNLAERLAAGLGLADDRVRGGPFPDLARDSGLTVRLELSAADAADGALPGKLAATFERGGED